MTLKYSLVLAGLLPIVGSVYAQDRAERFECVADAGGYTHLLKKDKPCKADPGWRERCKKLDFKQGSSHLCENSDAADFQRKGDKINVGFRDGFSYRGFDTVPREAYERHFPPSYYKDSETTEADRKIAQPPGQIDATKEQQPAKADKVDTGKELPQTDIVALNLSTAAASGAGSTTALVAKGAEKATAGLPGLQLYVPQDFYSDTFWVGIGKNSGGEYVRGIVTSRLDAAGCNEVGIEGWHDKQTGETDKRRNTVNGYYTYTGASNSLKVGYGHGWYKLSKTDVGTDIAVHEEEMVRDSGLVQFQSPSWSVAVQGAREKSDVNTLTRIKATNSDVATAVNTTEKGLLAALNFGSPSFSVGGHYRFVQADAESSVDEKNILDVTYKGSEEGLNAQIVSGRTNAYVEAIYADADRIVYRWGGRGFLNLDFSKGWSVAGFGYSRDGRDATGLALGQSEKDENDTKRGIFGRYLKAVWDLEKDVALTPVQKELVELDYLRELGRSARWAILGGRDQTEQTAKGDGYSGAVLFQISVKGLKVEIAGYGRTGNVMKEIGFDASVNLANSLSLGGGFESEKTGLGVNQSYRAYITKRFLPPSKNRGRD